MKKIFIAGGTGMLGAATAEAFAKEGVEVVLSSRKDQDPTGDRLTEKSDLISVERVDLLDLKTLKAVFARHDFDGMVFTAQTHQHALNREDANNIYPILLNSFETARQAGVKRVVLGGSVAAYGGLEGPYNEEATFPPRVSDKSIMFKFEVAVKRAMEIIALDYGEKFQLGLSIIPGEETVEPHELEVVVLRSPMMFGPGYYALGSPVGVGAHVAAGRIDTFKGYRGYGGAPVERLWHATAAIPCSYVKDNADCIKTAMLADEIKRPVYNICSGFPCNAREQLQAFFNAVPDCADRFGISLDDVPDKTHDLGFNNSLFAQDYGWKAGFTMESALTDYVGWLKDNPV